MDASVAFYATEDFWVAVAFLIVVGFAFRPIYRAVTAALDTRAEGISGRLDEARQLREEAQATLAEFQRRQRDAMKDAEKIVAHARTEADRLRKQAAQELEETAKRREQQVLERITQAETQAVAEVRNTAITIAVAATAKVLGETMTAQKADALVDETIQSLPAKFH